METIPHMETFLIYQTAYYVKHGGLGNFFSVKSLKYTETISYEIKEFFHFHHNM